MDKNLPDRCGADFISYLKACYHQTLVEMVTANDRQIVGNKAFRQDADDFSGNTLHLELINHIIERISAYMALSELFPPL